MKLACNYSPQLMELLTTGQTDVDYIKSGAFGPALPELSRMRTLRPVLLHGMGNHERTGMPGYEALDFARMNSLLVDCGSPHLAIHLGIRNADVSPGMTHSEICRRMVDSALYFSKNLVVPLLLENMGDSPEERTEFDLHPFVEPQWIARVLEETGAGFLLDIAHAKVAAQYRGWDFRSYLSDLPLALVREIHVTGTGLDGAGEPYDAHGPMEQSDYGLLEWVLGRTAPQILTLEYGCPAGAGAPEAEPNELLYEIHTLKKLTYCRNNEQ